MWEFQEVLDVTRGRTKAPVVRFRSTATGDPQDMIVKCLGREVAQRNLCCEYFGNALAREMGVHTPAPHLLDIDADTAAAMNRDALVRASGVEVPRGIAVGSEWFRPAPLPGISQKLTGAAIEEAARIFAYDLMMQQADRQVNNPNILEIRGHFVAIDFETSCGFLFDIIPNPAPWRVSAFPWVQRHFFRARLTPDSVDWRQLVYTMIGIDLGLLRATVPALPEPWHDDCESIVKHVEVLRDRASDLSWEIIRSVSGTLT